MLYICTAHKKNIKYGTCRVLKAKTNINNRKRPSLYFYFFYLEAHKEPNTKQKHKT